MQRLAVRAVLVLLLFIGASCAKREARAPTNTTTTQSTPPSVQSSAAVTPAINCLPPPPSGIVCVDMALIGLTTIADKSVARDSVTKTVILANQPGHQARFIAKYNNLDSGSRSKFKQLYYPNNTPSDYYYYDLDGVQIVLDYDPNQWSGTDVSFSSAGDNNNATAPTLSGQDQNDRSIHWIPSIKTVLGTTTDPRGVPEYFKKEPSKNNVSLRMPLPGGMLSSILRDPYWIWQFQTTGGGYKQTQVVADEVHYTFDLKPNKTTFVVYGRPFAQNGKPPDPSQALFTLQVAAPGEIAIPVFLTNSPPNDFLSDKPDLKVGYREPHFHLHYKLVADQPTEYNPIIIGSVNKPVDVSLPFSSTVYCGPDTFP